MLIKEPDLIFIDHETWLIKPGWQLFQLQLNENKDDYVHIIIVLRFLCKVNAL